MNLHLLRLVADVRISRVLSGRIVVGRVVCVASMKQAAARPLSAGTRCPRSTDGGGSLDALGLRLDHSCNTSILSERSLGIEPWWRLRVLTCARKAVGVRQHWAGDVADVRVSRILNKTQAICQKPLLVRIKLWWGSCVYLPGWKHRHGQSSTRCRRETGSRRPTRCRQRTPTERQ